MIERGRCDHAAVFYESDDDLVVRIAEFLAGAIELNGLGIAIATPDHAVALRSVLAARFRGADLDEGLRIIDAAPLLRSLLAAAARGGCLCDALEAALSPFLPTASESRPVRVFGEMVALLWEAAAPERLVELEAAWNVVASRRAFDLVCAYSTHGLDRPGSLRALKHVCELHSELRVWPTTGTDPQTSRGRAVYLPTTSELARVRRDVRNALTGQLDPLGLTDVLLVAGELTTNAIVHAGSPFRVSVDAFDDSPRIRIAVEDAAPDLFVRLAPAPGPVGGRGIAMLASLTHRWGVDFAPSGKTVWAELLGEIR